MTDRKYSILAMLLVWSLLAPTLISSDELYQERKVEIVEPKTGVVAKNPVRVCMEVEGLILEPAVNGVAEGKGHHHILFSSLPKDLSIPIPRKKAIHMVKGRKCLKLILEPGNHIVIALFSYGDHIPYNPPILDKILIRIEE